MARLGRIGFLALAIVFHIIYTYSIFDIYFVSPIVSGMREYGVEREPGAKAPAKRLVLFVGDGLRADKAFQSFPDPSPLPESCATKDSADCDGDERLKPRPLAPFVRSRVLNHGTFGVSHTRVPTESRPGHVALIAGLYEDVSAVMTGWKMNPVNFDSVFNRSRHTWSWGSPDILPMFKEGATPGRIDADSYDEDAEDFTKESTQLDVWVFDRVKALFKQAKEDPVLNKRLREDKVVFFLHLLGLDTAGHGYRPYSKEYLHNIQVVDQGVREITQLVEDFYDDGETAFIFTADHGMSDWGSHGDGHPDNTRTPLVAWGSGVAKPKYRNAGVAPGHEDGFSSDWNLDHVHRHDVAQADVAALMSYLVGLDFPVNSVGQLPLSYIDSTPKEKALATLANAQGVLEMYHVKEEQKKSSVIGYKPFGSFAQPGKSPEAQISAIRKLIAKRKYEESIARSSELLQEAVGGLRYLQTYDWLFLRAIVTAGYLGWIAYALTTVIDLHILHGSSQPVRSTSSTVFFSSLLVVLFSALWIQKSSWRYYAYAIFPIFFWEEVVARRAALSTGRSVLLGHIRSFSGYIGLALQLLVYVGVLEALVQSYFHREIYTVCYVIAGLWPAIYGSKFLSRNKFLVATWMVGCGLLSVFTLLPVIKVENTTTITLGGVLMFLTGLLYLIFEESITRQSKNKSITTSATSQASRVLMGLQMGLILLSMVVTRSSIVALQSKQGLPLGNQAVGWLVMVASLSFPFIHRLYPNNHYLHRLVVIFLTFSPTFIILTISYEGYFYFVFCISVLTWVRLEHKVYLHTTAPTSRKYPPSIVKFNNITTNASPETKRRYRSLVLADARIALFFLFFLQSAFFSTGNIASISSFSLDSVNRLIPVFNPFSQGALLILKILTPFAIISANLGILNRKLGVAPSALLMIVMAISDIMTLNFFYMVRDEGSWLDIGTTISHFCIGSFMSIFVAGLEFVSEAFIAGVDFSTVEDAPFVADNKVTEVAEVNLSANEQKKNGAVNGNPKSGPDASPNTNGATKRARTNGQSSKKSKGKSRW